MIALDESLLQQLINEYGKAISTLGACYEYGGRQLIDECKADLEDIHTKFAALGLDIDKGY